MPTVFDIKKRAMIEALEASLGIVTKAAEIAGIHRATHYEWMNNDPEYKAAVESIGDIALDFAESKLHSLIKEGDTTATIFFLKTKAKKRGYVERQEIENTHELKGKPRIIFDFGSENTADKATEVNG